MISLRIPDELHARIERRRREKGLSRSKFLREVVEKAVTPEPQRKPEEPWR